MQKFSQKWALTARLRQYRPKAGTKVHIMQPEIEYNELLMKEYCSDESF